MSAPVCPVCGQPKTLPSISPERLFFLCGDSVRRFATMPDGSGGDLYVISVENVAHVITPTHFAFYQRLCEHAADFTKAAA